MNEDAIVKIYLLKAKEDGFGGCEYENVYYKSINCEVAPITTKLIDANGRIINYQVLKLFTETKIDLEDFIAIYNDKQYKKYSETDYTEILMYELELI